MKKRESVKLNVRNCVKEIIDEYGYELKINNE
jgi:hypothetical protein